MILLILTAFCVSRQVLLGAEGKMKLEVWEIYWGECLWTTKRRENRGRQVEPSSTMQVGRPWKDQKRKEMSRRRLRLQCSFGNVSTGLMGSSWTKCLLENPVTKQKWSGSSSTAILSHWLGRAWGRCSPRMNTITDGQNTASGSC